MRAAALLLVLLPVAARGACIDPVAIAVGPRSVQPECSYWNGDLASEGSHVVGAWVTSQVSGFGFPIVTGSTAGGVLDARGRLRAAVQTPFNDAPGYPSVATNGQRALLAWSRSNFGTFAQFLDEAGTPVGAAAKLTDNGRTQSPPRATWNGRDWIVHVTDGPRVVSYRIDEHGAVLERTVVADDAEVEEAHRALLVIERASGFELITPAQRIPLPFIPAGAAVALDDRLLAWHGGGVGALRLGGDGVPTGMPIALANADPSTKRIAVAGEVVLWNDLATVHGARIGFAVMPLAPRDGYLYAAAATSDGVLALLSGTCFAVVSHVLAPGATAFEPVETVSRFFMEQTPRSVVPTARGHHVYWTEGRPHDGGTHLFVAQVEGGAARPAATLNAPGTAAGASDVAPFGGGSVVAWAEYPQGRLPGFVKVARVDANGAIAPAVTLGALHYLQEVAVTSDGDTIRVFTAEHPASAWIVDLWSSEVRPDGTVARERLEAFIDGFYLDAAATSAGPAVTWLDNDRESRDTRLLSVRDARGRRVFRVKSALTLQRIYGGPSPMILRLTRPELHAFFPATGAEVLVDTEAGLLLNATPRTDGSFDVASGLVDDHGTRIRHFHVTPQGTVTPREELCAAGAAFDLSMRDGIVDAWLTFRDGGVYLAKRAPARRRAVR